MPAPRLPVLLLSLLLLACDNQGLLSKVSGKLSHDHSNKIKFDHVEPASSSVEGEQSFKLEPSFKAMVDERVVDGAAGREPRNSPSSTINHAQVSDVTPNHHHSMALLHVPHKKQLGEQPEISTVDYQPPKTHDPSHN